MPRIRRIALLAALAVVGALGLTACGKEQPGTAAYVGDVRFTDKQLDGMVAEGRRYQLDRGPSAIRKLTLGSLVVTELSRRIARERGINIPAPDYGYASRELGMPATTQYVHTYAEYAAVVGAVFQRLEPVQATDDLLRPYYDDLTKTEIVDPAYTYAQFAQQARQSTQLPLDLALWEAIRAAAKKTPITVNPRYLPLFAVYDQLPWVVATGGTPVKASPPARSSTDPNDEEDPNAPAN